MSRDVGKPSSEMALTRDGGFVFTVKQTNKYSRWRNIEALKRNDVDCFQI